MVLSSVDLAATTDTTLHKAGQLRSIHKIVVCNRNATSVKIRVWVVPADTIKADTHAWVYDKKVGPNDTVFLVNQPFSLSLFETIVVRSDTANVSMSAIGA